METSPEIWLLDITSWAFRAIHASPPLTNSKGIPTGGAFLFARMLLSLLDRHRPEHVCAVWDAPTRSFRKDLSPDYKAHRTPLEPHFKSQLKLCRAVVKALPLPVLQVPGVEADDTLASLAMRAALEGFRPIVASPDKDLQVLVGPDCRVFNPQKDAWVDEAAVLERWGVAPYRISDLLALTGDASDNIKGVAGIGPKTAAALIQEYGSLDGVVAHAGKVKGKRGEALRAAVADGTLELARKLTALRYDVELPMGPAEMRTPAPDLVAREFLFRALEFTSLLPSDAMPTAEQLAAKAGTFDAEGRRAG